MDLGVGSALELAGSALAASFMNCLDDTSRIGFLRFGHPDELPPDGARESSSVAMRRKNPARPNFQNPVALPRL